MKKATEKLVKECMSTRGFVRFVMKNATEKLVKKWYRKQLLANGYDSAEIVKSPADIRATKDGEFWWFEIKYTTAKDLYYRGSTETEWEQAFKDPEHFRFVVIQKNKSGSKFVPKEYTPEEFIKLFEETHEFFTSIREKHSNPIHSNQ